MQILVQSWTSSVITQLSVSKFKGSSESGATCMPRHRGNSTNQRVPGSLRELCRASARVPDAHKKGTSGSWSNLQTKALRKMIKGGSTEQGPWNTEWWVLLKSSCRMMDHLVSTQRLSSVSSSMVSFVSGQWTAAAPVTALARFSWPPCYSEVLELSPCLTLR